MDKKNSEEGKCEFREISKLEGKRWEGRRIKGKFNKLKFKKGDGRMVWKEKKLLISRGRNGRIKENGKKNRLGRNYIRRKGVKEKKNEIDII